MTSQLVARQLKLLISFTFWFSLKIKSPDRYVKFLMKLDTLRYHNNVDRLVRIFEVESHCCENGYFTNYGLKWKFVFIS